MIKLLGPNGYCSFQFLGIPPKGELIRIEVRIIKVFIYLFPISRDPPEGGTSRDPIGARAEGQVSNF